MTKVQPLRAHLASRVKSCFSCPFRQLSSMSLAGMFDEDVREYKCVASVTEGARRVLPKQADDAPPPDWCTLRHHTIMVKLDIA